MNINDKKYGRPGEINGGHRCYELVLSIHESWDRRECRLMIANEYTLADLHEVIQTIMGWTGRYDHLFEMRDGRCFRTLTGESDSLIDQLYPDAAGIRLREIRDELDERMSYVYGDHAQWTVLIKRLRTVAATGEVGAPQMITAPIEAPPEDLLDWATYEALLDASGKPTASRHTEALEVMALHVQPLDRDDANEQLESLFHVWGVD